MWRVRLLLAVRGSRGLLTLGCQAGDSHFAPIVHYLYIERLDSGGKIITEAKLLEGTVNGGHQVIRSGIWYTHRGVIQPPLTNIEINEFTSPK